MQIENDRIIFESRREIGEVQNALEDYLETAQGNENKSAQRLYDLLDVMSMSW